MLYFVIDLQESLNVLNTIANDIDQNFHNFHSNKEFFLFNCYMLE